MSKTVGFLLTVLLPLTAGAKDYVITDYGAVSDTTRLSTEAIQCAVDACSAAGGGRVVVPAGQYATGTLVLRSHVNLYLEQGATLYGSTDLRDYRPMKSDYVSLRTHTTTIHLLKSLNRLNIIPFPIKIHTTLNPLITSIRIW